MYNGIYIASEQSQAITTGDVLIELQVPANTSIEVLRAWVGAADNAVDDTQEIEIYANATAGTGGTALTETELQGVGDGTSGVTALGGPTIGGGSVDLYPDGFHLLNGWLYLPVPEERIRIAGRSAVDNVGFRFPTAPGASITVSYGVIWGEIG